MNRNSFGLVLAILIGLAAYGWYMEQSTTPAPAPATTESTGEAVANTPSQPTTSTPASAVTAHVWAIPDTGQTKCYNAASPIACPAAGQSFYGQDGTYSGAQLRYTDNGDGTVTDAVTGLMWIKDAGSKVAYYTGIGKAQSYSYAGYSDWRVPTIKELYSLIDFNGKDVDPTAKNADTPFIDTSAFVFNYGDMSTGDRVIDSQWITTNVYVAKVMNNQECFFGVNFADGRIKCYPTADNGHNNGYYLRLVRGTSGYGVNHFTDNGDGTVTDASSGLTWQQGDSGKGRDWQGALSYCENLTLGGKSDWRLPNAHELEYIVDYSRSPDTTGSPALDPVFNATAITNERGQKDWPYYWTGTTHADARGASQAVYVSFGRAIGKMNGQIMDVHGAGAQRSDPKVGNASDYPQYFGPQGDARRVFNYARCVRG